MDFDEIFWKCRGWYKDQSIRFWKLSVERRPPPTFMGEITPTDHIFMKIVPEKHQGPRKSPLHFQLIHIAVLLSIKIVLEIYLGIGKFSLHFDTHS